MRVWIIGLGDIFFYMDGGLFFGGKNIIGRTKFFLKFFDK
jgi:hypothetical protein